MPYLKVANVSICQPKLLDVEFGFRHALEARFPGENRALAPLGFCQCHRSLMQNCQAKAFSQTFFLQKHIENGIFEISQHVTSFSVKVCAVLSHMASTQKRKQVMKTGVQY